MLTVWQHLLDRVADTARIDTYRANPAIWARERLDAHLWTKQVEIADSVAANRRTAVKSCHGVGKALPLDTPIPTPTGWSTMGDLRPGDAVLDEQGKPCRVVGKTQVWDLDCYRITFDDGTQQVCTGEHEWNVIDLRHRPRNIADWRDHWGATCTMDTRTMAESVKTGGQRRWRIPTTNALDLPAADLPIDPYAFGVWLGDGTSSRPEVTCDPADVESMERIRAAGENVSHEGGFRWNLTGPLPDRQRFHNRLRQLGVLRNKHIPTSYLRASKAQRLELLRGLMDSDGFNSGSGVGMDLCHERLAADVAELVTSMGWKITTREGVAKCNGVPSGTRWRMYFCPDVPVFHLARKREAQALRGSQRSRQTQRTIVSIEPVEAVPTVCIEVDSPRHLYLAGRSMVPTHNSWTAGMLAAWWIDTHPVGEAIVVSTAPTYKQVHAVLWEEIRKQHRIGGLDGTVNLADEWTINAQLVGMGRKPADHDAHGFQGIHRRYVLVIIDEACGVPANIYTAVEAITTNADCRILAIGNPDDPNTEFGAICKPGSGWNVIRVRSQDSPNFTGEDVPDALRHLLPTPEWVEDAAKRWGVDSPLYTSKVEGEFPEVGDNTLIPSRWITEAQNRDCPPEHPISVSADVARFGKDKTIIGVREGRRFRIVRTISSSPTTVTAGEVRHAMADSYATRARIDGVGVGGGVVDLLREQGVLTDDLQAGGRAMDSERFANARAEWFWGLRKRFEDGDIDIDPGDDELAAQLGSIRYEYTSRGQIKIESKDDMLKRGLPSPDRADALMLAYAVTPAAGQMVEPDEFAALDEQGFVYSPY